MALDEFSPDSAAVRNGFMAVIVTNGAGSPRDGIYSSYDDQQMQEIRRVEQKKAAFVASIPRWRF